MTDQAPENRLAKIESILHGNGSEGLLSRTKRIEDLLEGDGKAFGMATKVAILWRGHLWVLCTASGLLGTILGAAGTIIVQRVANAQ